MSAVITASNANHLALLAHLPIDDRLLSGALCWSSDGRHLIVVGERNIWGFTPDSLKPSPFVLTANRNQAMSVAANSTHLALGGTDSTIHVLGFTDGQAVRILNAHSSYVGELVYSSDGRFLASAGTWDESVCLWDAHSHELLFRFKDAHPDSVLSVDFAASDSRVICGGLDGTIAVWDIEAGTQLTRLMYHTAGVNAVKYCPLNNRLVSGDLDGGIAVWDLSTGLVEATLTHREGIQDISRSRDETLFFTGGLIDNTIRCWEFENFAQAGAISHLAAGIQMALSPDGTMLASTDGKNRVSIWSYPT